jgi:hypothetical protein
VFGSDEFSETRFQDPKLRSTLHFNGVLAGAGIIRLSDKNYPGPVKLLMVYAIPLYHWMSLMNCGTASRRMGEWSSWVLQM